MATLRSPRVTTTLESGAIAAGAAYTHDYAADPKTAREVPYNTIMIQNLSTQLIEAKYGDSKIFISSGQTWYDSKAYGIRFISMTNCGTAATDGIINIVVSRQVDSDAAIVSFVTGDNMYDVANGLV